MATKVSNNILPDEFFLYLKILSAVRTMADLVILTIGGWVDKVSVYAMKGQ